MEGFIHEEDGDCGYFKDQIVTTDTQTGTIKGPLEDKVYICDSPLPTGSRWKRFITVICFLLPGIHIKKSQRWLMLSHNRRPLTRRWSLYYFDKLQPHLVL